MYNNREKNFYPLPDFKIYPFFDFQKAAAKIFYFHLTTSDNF